MTTSNLSKARAALWAPVNCIVEAGKFLAEAGGLLVTNSDGFEKGAKFAACILDGGIKIYNHVGTGAKLVATVALQGELKAAAELVAGLGLINRIYEFTCPARGETKPFWLAKPFKEVGLKFLSRAMLTVGQAMEFIKLGNTLGLYSLGSIISTTMGGIPIFGAIKDSFIIGSSIFSMGNSIQAITGFWKKPGTGAWSQFNVARKQCSMWKAVGEALNNPGSPKAQALEARLVQKCVAKEDKWEKDSNEFKEEITRIIDENAFANLRDRLDDPADAALLDDIFAHIDAQEIDLLVAIYQSTGQPVSAEEQKIAKERKVSATNSVRVSLVKLRGCQDKKAKWKGLLEKGEGETRLYAGIGGYCAGKVDRVGQKAVHEVQLKVNKMNELAETIQVDILKAHEALRGDFAEGEKITKPDLGKAGYWDQFDATVLDLSEAKEALKKLDALKGDNGINKYVDFQHKTYRAKTINGFIDLCKPVLALAYDVSKIAIIVFSIICLAAGLVAFGWTMAIFAVALVVTGLGLFKFFYDDILSKKLKVKPPILADMLV